MNTDLPPDSSAGAPRPADAPASADAAPSVRRRAAMDDAGDRRRRALETARLYVCVDLSRSLSDLLTFADAAFRGGVDILQVRDKHAEARAEVEALRALRPVADAHGALLAANDRADVAVLAGVDVLHLGQGDLTTEDARALVGPEVLVGRSTRTLEQVREAEADPGIDYFCTGPVWSTPTKPDRAAVGLELPRAAAELTADHAGHSGHAEHADHADHAEHADHATPGGASKPFFAIGGVDVDRIPEVRDAGAERVVVVRAVTEATDPEAAARALRDALVTEA